MPGARIPYLRQTFFGKLRPARRPGREPSRSETDLLRHLVRAGPPEDVDVPGRVVSQWMCWRVMRTIRLTKEDDTRSE